MAGPFPFYKYEGTGNDFVLVQDPDGSMEFRLDRPAIARICDRHFGVGADGLMLLQKIGGYDFRMVYFNSDGRESTFCGNGSRCIVALAQRLGWIADEAFFVAADGDHEARLVNPGRVAVHMRSVREVGKVGDDCMLDTGSPHYVRFHPDVSSADLVFLARSIRYAPPWKEEGVNVNLVEERSDGLFVRTYERGVEGETLSCGTGVTASAIAWASRNAGFGPGSVQVSTPGGDLVVRWEAGHYGFRDVWLEGPARMVFQGEYTL